MRTSLWRGRAAFTRPAVAGTVAAVLALTTGAVGPSGSSSTTTTAAGVAAGQPETPPAKTRLMKPMTFYPRALRLAHSGPANGRVMLSVVTDTPSHTGVIFESTDDGAHFGEVGRIADAWGAAPRGGCCSSIFELPRRIGAMPEGTLLWASSMGRGARQAKLRLWKSNDLGRTWTFVSSPFSAPNGLGVWEPELSIDAAGRLVVHFADETEQPAHSQVLARVVSSDGVDWSAKAPTVVGAAWERPGMPVVAELPNGQYVMTYEICGLATPYNCDVRLRYSDDGWSWGEPTDLGVRPTTTDGRYFTHTPTITWSPGDSPDGKLFLAGQILQERAGQVAPTNGTSVLTNTENGRGLWYEMAAPVHVPDARDAVCPNYSPTLLPSADGQKLLEVTTDTAPEGICAAYFATGSAVGSALDEPQPPASLPHTWQRLVNSLSSHCLDVVGASTAPGTPIGQWLCLDGDQQQYRVKPIDRTSAQLVVKSSKLCVTVDSASPAAGTPVVQQPCADEGAARTAQQWSMVEAGRSMYRLVHHETGLCAEQANDDGAPGGRVLLARCVEQQRQVWQLRTA